MAGRFAFLSETFLGQTASIASPPQARFCSQNDGQHFGPKMMGSILAPAKCCRTLHEAPRHNLAKKSNLGSNSLSAKREQQAGNCRMQGTTPSPLVGS